MDFLKLIRSLEELLFEALAWLVYYPRTLWLVVRRPLRMMDYADHEQRIHAEEPYADALSPPLFLLLTILLTHAVALAVASAVHSNEAAVTHTVFGSHQNLVLARSLGFAMLPMVAAVVFLWRSGRTFERRNLRPPFFGQCYLAAPYALAVSLSVLAMEAPERTLVGIGAALLLVATLLYFVVQAAQFRRCLGLGAVAAGGLALLVYLAATVVVFGIGLVALGLGDR